MCFECFGAINFPPVVVAVAAAIINLRYVCRFCIWRKRDDSRPLRLKFSKARSSGLLL